MSWTDDEIDKLYQTGAAGSQFEYKAEYWREMEAMLPIQKKRGDALWFFFLFALRKPLKPWVYICI